MRRLLVLCAVERISACAIDTVDVVHIFQIRNCEGALSVVGIDRIVLSREICIVGTAASDGTDPLDIIIVLEDRHVAVHIALHRRLVDHICPVDAVLRQGCLIIAHHDRDRPSVGLRHVHHLTGQVTLDLSVDLFALLRAFRLRLRLRRRFCLKNDGLRLFRRLCGRLRCHSCFLSLLSAPGKSCRCHHDSNTNNKCSAPFSHLL